MLESMLKDATESANEAEKKYEEVRSLHGGRAVHIVDDQPLLPAHGDVDT